jgi:hypothetical protein
MNIIQAEGAQSERVGSRTPYVVSG